MKKIAVHVYDPSRPSLFKIKKTERAFVDRYFCTLESQCPLLEEGKCIHREFLRACVYGKQTREEGPTQRSKSFLKFISGGLEEQKETPDVEGWSKSICYIGDYVYLPYSQIDLEHGGYDIQEYRNQEALPFRRNSALFVTGIPFMEKALFTPEMVWRIVQWRPQAIMGGEIKSYQSEEMPRFLRDLRAYDPSLYLESVKLHPEIAEKVPSNRKSLVGKRAQIGRLPSGKVKIGSHYYQWDSQENTLTTSEDVVLFIGKTLKTIIYPDAGLIVEICDPEMAESLPEDFMPD